MFVTTGDWIQDSRATANSVTAAATHRQNKSSIIINKKKTKFFIYSTKLSVWTSPQAVTSKLRLGSFNFCQYDLGLLSTPIYALSSFLYIILYLLDFIYWFVCLGCMLFQIGCFSPFYVLIFMAATTMIS